MTTQHWLTLAQTALNEAGVASARLDALLLLEDATGNNRATILAHPEALLSQQQLQQLADTLERRLQHEPMAYIRGHAEFYGHDFFITPDVLVPRPESESIISLLKTLPTPKSIADIGSGSGVLAITAALQTGAPTFAVDIDEACLTVVKHNAVNHSANVVCLAGDLLEPLQGQLVAVILANLPYVPQNYPINEAAKHEPALALYGGPDGLNLYRRLFTQTSDTKTQHIITEALLSQHADLRKIATQNGYTLKQTDGLAQLFTVNK